MANDDPNISFTWFRDGSQLPNETSSSLEVEEEGTYEVEVSNQGCLSNSTITITGYAVDNCTSHKDCLLTAMEIMIVWI